MNLSHATEFFNPFGLEDTFSWAEAYLRAGFHVIPSWRVVEGKLQEAFPFRWKELEKLSCQELFGLWVRWKREGLRGSDGTLWPLDDCWGIALLTGPSGIVVFDADCPEAASLLMRLACETGAGLIFTRSDGSRAHLLCQLPEELRGRKLPMQIEVNGVILEVKVGHVSPLPPSVHRKPEAGGFRYRWEIPDWRLPLHVEPVDWPMPRVLYEELRGKAVADEVARIYSMPLFGKEPKSNNRLKQRILRLLEELDLVKGEFISRGRRFLRLRFCPFCYGIGNYKTANPYLNLESFRYHCFRRIKCPVGSQGGVGPRELLRQLEKLRGSLRW